jgi:hypothetical protein
MADDEKEATGCSCGGFGCTTGAFCAAFLSYAINKSFWWAVFHFFCSWIYVFYAAIVRIKDVVAYFKDALN